MGSGLARICFFGTVLHFVSLTAYVVGGNRARKQNFKSNQVSWISQAPCDPGTIAKWLKGSDINPQENRSPNVSGAPRLLFTGGSP